MTISIDTARPGVADTHRAARPETTARSTLAVAVIGFFVVTFDAVVVNVALPSIRSDLGGGVAGLQWVVDGYTLMFAALLLTAGSISDRVGARRAFGAGLVVFAAASLACGLAPGLGWLVLARFVQGAAAAAMMPASMALIGQAYPTGAPRARAVAIWAMGGAVASSTGPVLGGLLTTLDWRWIFLVNVPVAAMALVVLHRTDRSPRRESRVDISGLITGVVAMGGLTYGVIEAGAVGLGSPRVVAALGVALIAAVAFVVGQRRGRHPMVPRALFADRAVVIVTVVGFAFMVGYYGLPFVISLYFQQHRGLSALQAGALFLPMMLIGAALTPVAPRLAARFGARATVVAGLLTMTAGLVALALLPSTAPLALVSTLMILVGLGGPLVMPPATAVLLDAIPGHLSGTASGVFNTSRQVGGALAIAVFGGLLATPATFTSGLRDSLLIAAAVVLVAAVIAARIEPTAAAEPS